MLIERLGDSQAIVLTWDGKKRIVLDNELKYFILISLDRRQLWDLNKAGKVTVSANDKQFPEVAFIYEVLRGI